MHVPNGTVAICKWFAARWTHIEIPGRAHYVEVWIKATLPGKFLALDSGS